MTSSIHAEQLHTSLQKLTWSCCQQQKLSQAP